MRTKPAAYVSVLVSILLTAAFLFDAPASKTATYRATDSPGAKAVDPTQ